MLTSSSCMRPEVALLAIFALATSALLVVEPKSNPSKITRSLAFKSALKLGLILAAVIDVALSTGLFIIYCCQRWFLCRALSNRQR